MNPRRLKFTVAYDGAPFAGWQMQDGPRPTVQGSLELAFAALTGGERVVVHGSGRTDAGVHALGQIAQADIVSPTGSLAAASRWPQALNARLPAEIRVLRAAWTTPAFHARFSATGKTYRYRIWNAPTLHPLERGRAWHVPPAIDPALLRSVLGRFEGTHDYAAFAANRGDGTAPRTTVRTIERARVSRRGALFTLEFSGDGFLYKMVRLLTGAAVRVATGREGLSWIDRFLATPRDGKNRYLAPADGLYLTHVRYPRRLTQLTTSP